MTPEEEKYRDEHWERLQAYNRRKNKKRKEEPCEEEEKHNEWSES